MLVNRKQIEQTIIALRVRRYVKASSQHRQIGHHQCNQAMDLMPGCGSTQLDSERPPGEIGKSGQHPDAVDCRTHQMTDRAKRVGTAPPSVAGVDS
jgi:hypothetical protein